MRKNERIELYNMPCLSNNDDCEILEVMDAGFDNGDFDDFSLEGMDNTEEYGIDIKITEIKE